MQLFELNPTLTEEQNIKHLIPEGDEILNTFEVVPLDQNINNLSTPKFILSRKKLLFLFDNYVESQELANLNFEILGEEPKYSAWQQLFESKYRYAPEYLLQFIEMRNDITITRVSVYETSKLPRSFLLRNGKEVGRPFQTWAMYQILINTKNSQTIDTSLNEMCSGYFTTFNNKTVYAFLASFIIFILLTTILGSILPEFIKTILNFIFGIICIAMLYWTYMSVEKNNKRFKNVYLRYRSLVKPTPIVVETTPRNPTGVTL